MWSTRKALVCGMCSAFLIYGLLLTVSWQRNFVQKVENLILRATSFEKELHLLRGTIRNNTVLYRKAHTRILQLEKLVGMKREFWYIPHIIHQSWKDTNLPSRFKYWQKSWFKCFPNWKYILWTDKDNDELVKKHFPQFYNFYIKLPRKILKIDLVRYFRTPLRIT